MLFIQFSLKKQLILQFKKERKAITHNQLTTKRNTVEKVLRTQ